jgi:hypothetical protein
VITIVWNDWSPPLECTPSISQMRQGERDVEEWVRLMRKFADVMSGEVSP